MGFIVPLENSSYGDVTFTDEGPQILNNARHSWLLSSDCSLTCQTTVTRGIFYNGKLRGPTTLKLIAKRLAVELSLPDFTT